MACPLEADRDKAVGGRARVGDFGEAASHRRAGRRRPRPGMANDKFAELVLMRAGEGGRRRLKMAASAAVLRVSMMKPDRMA